MSPLTLANENTLQDLITAIAIKAAQDSNDMLTDFIADPQYVKDQGIPTKTVFKQSMVNFLTDTYPDQLTEHFEGQSSDVTASWDDVWQVVAKEVIRRWPDLTVLTVDLPA